MGAVIMPKIIVIGGGWAGCAAALAAAKAGSEVTLIEKTDMLLGTGLVGGIMRNNGRFTATEEMIALGGGDLFELCDRTSRHKNINFPGHEHASLYDILTTPVEVLQFIYKLGVNIQFESRVTKIHKEAGKILAVEDQDGRKYQGDAFVDATGTAGPMNHCRKYGNGCAMCILRCPSYGGRISITSLAGVNEMVGKKENGSIGAMSGSCKICKDSLSKEIQKILDDSGVAIVNIPEELKEDHLEIKACQQYAMKEFKDNVILLDTGHAKLMAPFYSLDRLRKIPGFENARYEDPYAAGKGNSIRFLGISPHDNSLKVTGLDNLFCAGEKIGPFIGHTEAIVTGTLAGHNAARSAFGLDALELPKELAVGDAIAYIGEEINTGKGLYKKYTFSGSIYFERMKEKKLYSTDISKVRERVFKLGYENVFNKKLAKQR